MWLWIIRKLYGWFQRLDYENSVNLDYKWKSQTILMQNACYLSRDTDMMWCRVSPICHFENDRK